MTIFEKALMKVIYKRCRHENWWDFGAADDFAMYWQENEIRVYPSCRFYAISVNESKLNVVGFDALSEQPDIDSESAIITSFQVEDEYEQMLSGQ